MKHFLLIQSQRVSFDESQTLVQVYLLLLPNPEKSIDIMKPSWIDVSTGETRKFNL